jgi:hypothetical protein
VTITQTPAAAPQPKASAPNPDRVFRNFVLQIPGMRVVDWGIAQTAIAERPRPRTTLSQAKAQTCGQYRQVWKLTAARSSVRCG